MKARAAGLALFLILSAQLGRADIFGTITNAISSAADTTSNALNSAANTVRELLREHALKFWPYAD